MTKIQLPEPLTISHIGQCAKIIQKALSHQDEPIILDLSHVEDCDTAGVQLLISTHKTANQDNKTVVFDEASDAVKDAFLRAGINDMNSFLSNEL